MSRVIRRTLWRGASRRELWNGNRESLTHLFRRMPADNIVLWAWTSYAGTRRRYADLAAAGARVIRLATPHAAHRWLAAVNSQQGSRIV